MTDFNDTQDRLTRRVLWSLPTGLYVVGGGDLTNNPAGANLMTANLVVQVATNPRVLLVSFERASVTLALVRSSRQLSVSILDRSDRAVVRKFVKPVAAGLEVVDGIPTMAGQPVVVGATGLPRLAGAVAWLEATVVAEEEFDSHVAIFASVVSAGARRDFDGAEILRMEDTRMNYGG